MKRLFKSKRDAAAALLEPIERGERCAVSVDGRLWGIGIGGGDRAAYAAGVVLREAIFASRKRKRK